MAFDLSTLNAYTDELSLDLISKAVLNTKLMEYVNVRPGLTAGTVAINLLSGDLNVSDRSCGFTPSGDIDFTQVEITLKDKQVKMTACRTDLLQYWTAMKMNPSANAEDIPFEEVIVEYYIKKIAEYNEDYLINGDGVTLGLKSQITVANGANIALGTPAAWTRTNSVEQALDLYDAIAPASIDREDLLMVVSPAAYRALVGGLVAANLFHYNSVDGNEILYVPGTQCRVVKSSGLVGSDNAFAGPAEFIVVGVGLTDDSESFRMMYDPFEDITKMAAYWRIGVAVSQVDQFATNGLA
jgi:hypothetical protein